MHFKPYVSLKWKSLAVKKLCEQDSCELGFQYLFATSNKSQNWNNELNKGVVPRQVFLN